jgi:hypothetical protein
LAAGALAGTHYALGVANAGGADQPADDHECAGDADANTEGLE